MSKIDSRNRQEAGITSYSYMYFFHALLSYPIVLISIIIKYLHKFVQTKCNVMMKNKCINTDAEDVSSTSSSTPEPEEDDAAKTYRVSTASASGNQNHEASEDDKEQYDEGRGLIGIGAELQNSFENNTSMPTSNREFGEAERFLLEDEDIYKINDTNTTTFSSTPGGENAANAKTSRDTSSCSAGPGDRDNEDDSWYDEDEESGLLRNSFDLESAERSLPEDTFSFLIYCDINSRSFVLGILVFLFQIAIYIILTANIVEDEPRNGNIFGFPETASVPLRISECLAILISIITQTDARKAICLYRDGFDEAGLTQVFQGASFWKWSLSIGLRASEGLLGLIIAFLLIMQSDDVLELLLNFSAIEFVTLLDDVVFELVREGFFGREMKKEAKRLSKMTYSVSQDCANSKSATVLSLLYFVVLFLTFFGSWGNIVSKQSRGFYFCDIISSQFSDEVLSLSVSSKRFYRRQEGKKGGRSIYRHVGTQELLFAYCEREKRWTLFINDTDTTEWDPCNGWLAASSTRVSADSSLLESASFPWLIKNQTTMTERVTAHLLECYDEKNAPITIAPSSPPSALSQFPPSTQPSLSFHPSISSTVPSLNPSIVTRKPSVSPSCNPTNQLSSLPSNKPSAQSSPIPSSKPTPTLTIHPTIQPTTQPATPPPQPPTRIINTKTSKSSLFGDFIGDA